MQSKAIRIDKNEKKNNKKQKKRTSQSGMVNSFKYNETSFSNTKHLNMFWNENRMKSIQSQSKWLNAKSINGNGQSKLIQNQILYVIW